MTGNVVPSNSSMTSLYPASPLGTFTLHLEPRPDPGIYIYLYIYTHIYICTYTDIRVGSPRIARMHAAACTATSLPRVHPTVHTWKPSIRTCGRNCGTAAHPVGCVGCVRDYVRTSLIFTTPNTIRNVSDGKKRLISFSSSF